MFLTLAAFYETDGAPAKRLAAGEIDFRGCAKRLDGELYIWGFHEVGNAGDFDIQFASCTEPLVEETYGDDGCVCGDKGAGIDDQHLALCWAKHQIGVSRGDLEMIAGLELCA